MAGYIMTLSDIDSMRECVETGIYSTLLKDPQKNKWGTPQEGTFADYLSMKPGDSIYFFHKRKVYGIGTIVNIGFDCKYLNYTGSDLPKDYSCADYSQLKPLLKNGTPNNRCLCTFVPSPAFFMNGVDMDDVLSSNPGKFRIFRTMWKVSFIKVDDEENKALQDIILKRNEDFIDGNIGTFPFYENTHNYISSRIETLHRLNAYNILLSAKKGNKIKHEMAIEAALCDILIKDNETPFGTWDYISHQVAASPFKPIDYMDKMDIFGYRYIKGFQTISKYLVIEIKKDAATEDVIAQMMKYVDWIDQEYAHGDYSMVEAYIVASDFSEDVIKQRDQQCIRNYTKGYRPTQACTWRNCKLIKYEYIDGNLSFTEVY